MYEDRVVAIGAAVLSASMLAATAMPRGIVVPGRLAVTRYVRAGDAILLRWDAGAAGADFRADAAPGARPLPPIALGDGMIVRHDGRRHAHLVGAAARDVVTLTATIKPDAAALMREYAVRDGALLRVAALDDAASRTAMLLTLLRHSRRTDAAPLFDAATRDPAFFARWEAMREWLALDARAALPRLTDMAAGDPHGEVRDAAATTLAIVHARMTPCPA